VRFLTLPQLMLTLNIPSVSTISGDGKVSIKLFTADQGIMTQSQFEVFVTEIQL
jgi:hypothetical protein